VLLLDSQRRCLNEMKKLVKKETKLRPGLVHLPGVNKSDVSTAQSRCDNWTKRLNSVDKTLRFPLRTRQHHTRFPNHAMHSPPHVSSNVMVVGMDEKWVSFRKKK